MKVCIVGAGAIGVWIGTRLASARIAHVSVIARGATLDALNTQGWRLLQAGALLQAPAVAASNAEDLGEQDLVILAVKGPALASALESVKALLGQHTVVLPAMNGVPWWFSQDIAAIGKAPLESVDPGGSISFAIPLHHIIGCVIHASATTVEPGLAEHKTGQGLIIGEPGGEKSARVRHIGNLLGKAGFEVSLSPDIRNDIWYKLWGNMTINPVSALTGATADRILDDPLVREFCSAAMREVAGIGERIGFPLMYSPEDRHAVTRKLGAFKTSMLQDVEGGRPIELDSIVSVVHEIGRRIDFPTPNVDALLGLTRLFGKVKGLYPAT